MTAYLIGVVVVAFLFWLVIGNKADAGAYVVLAIFAFGWPLVVVIGMVSSPYHAYHGIRAHYRQRRELDARWRALGKQR